MSIGCGGVVYKKALLDIDFLFDKEFLELAPTTDDLWFKAASLKKGVPVSVYPKIDLDNRHIKHRKGLAKSNLNFINNNSRAKKGANLLLNEIINYLGVNQTHNDCNWDKILDYAKYTSTDISKYL